MDSSSSRLTESCVICGSGAVLDAFSIRNADYPDSEANVVKCRDCGVGRTEYVSGRIPTEEEYPDSYYSYSPNGYSKLKVRAKHALDVAAPYVFSRALLNRWLTMQPPKRTGAVLDVGCGCGVSLDRWKSLGWSTFGTEISEKPVEICRAKGHKAVVATSPEGLFEPEQFDWITLDNVLEHMDEPESILGSLRPSLKPDGVLTICVPNFGSGDAKLFGPYWDALAYPEHRFHYTGVGVSQLLRRNGFEALRVTYQPRFHSRPTMRNVRAYASAEETKTLRRKFFRLQLQKATNMFAARGVAERYGYFLTVDARKI